MKERVRWFMVVCLGLQVATVALPASAEQDAAKAIGRFAQANPAARIIVSRETGYIRMASGFSIPTLKGAVAPAVQQFLLENTALFGLDHPAVGLALDRVTRHGRSHYVRFAQTIDGMEVFGAGIIGHVDGSSRLVRVHSSTVPASDAFLDPELDEGQAMAAATRDLPHAAAPSNVVLGYYPVQGRPVLSYLVITAMPGMRLFHSFVSASSGALLARFDAMKHYKAKLWPESPAVNDELVEIELENFVAEGDHALHAYGSSVRVASCTSEDEYGCVDWQHNAVAMAEQGFLGVLPNEDADVQDDGFAELMVYYTVDRISQYYREEFGFDGQFGDAEWYRDNAEVVQADYLWVLVNLAYENGAYAGGSDWGGHAAPDMIILGRVFGKDLAYDNNVIAHEYTHAISAKAFNVLMGNADELGFDMSSGAVEEGNADFFANSFFGNPDMGEYAGFIDRNSKNDHVCPDDMMGESHEDSMIVSGAMWAIREKIGRRKAEHLLYETMVSTQIGTLTDFGSGLAASAKFMSESDTVAADLRLKADEVAFVETEIEKRNLIECKRLVPLGEDDARIHYFPFGMGELGSPSSVQWVVTTGPQTGKLELSISPMAEQDYDVLVRKGEPVTFAWEGSSYHDVSWTAQYDAAFAYDDTGEAITEVVIDYDSTPAIEPNSKYYFSIICKATGYENGCQSLLSVTLEDAPPPQDTDEDTDASTETPDTDSDTGKGQPEKDAGDVLEEEEESKKSGCGCRVAGSDRAGQLLRALAEAL